MKRKTSSLSIPERCPHRRFNPLEGQWVLVSPHRTQRPWQGQHEEDFQAQRPRYDSECYLCPGNQRAGGKANPEYRGLFVFENDYPALVRETPLGTPGDDPLFMVASEQGVCKVMCFSHRHDLSVPRMELKSVEEVVVAWKSEYEGFQSDPGIAYVQIFENKGAIMGCSNPHPHCQIWASSSIPSVVSREHENQARYFADHGRPMLVDYLAREIDLQARLVYENESFVVLVPFWAVWPFETMILPRRHRPAIDRFNATEIRGLADAYRTLTQTYDRVFDCEFPYTAGIHQAPLSVHDRDCWQFHMHFYPPLLRSARVKKFMVGYEMLASPQRDITAETAAETLRRVLGKADSS